MAPSRWRVRFVDHQRAKSPAVEAIMTLPKSPLGSSGVPITLVGLGAWALGGGGWRYSWGPQDDAMSIATVRHALLA